MAGHVVAAGTVIDDDNQDGLRACLLDWAAGALRSSVSLRQIALSFHVT